MKLRAVPLLGYLCIAASLSAQMGPLTTGANPRYFYRPDGKPVLLTGSHTWTNIIDRGVGYPPPVFDYPGYLNSIQNYGHNFFKLFDWEQTRWANWDSSNNYWFSAGGHWIFQRTGPGNALDGMPKFDLTKFDQAYFDRIRQRIIDAGAKNMYVAVMLFSGWSNESKKGDYNVNNPWKGHPYNGSNNINSINADTNSNNSGEEVHHLTGNLALPYEEAYVRKVIDTVNDLDNVLYEICNECNSNANSFENHFIDLIHTYEAGKPKQHPVIYSYIWPGGDDAWALGSNADAVALHADYSGSGAIYSNNKVLISDTDHICGTCLDGPWAWGTFMNGGNPLYMDPWGTGTPDQEANAATARPAMGQIQYYANTRFTDLGTMTPLPNLSNTGYCLGRADANRPEFLAYRPGGSTAFQINLASSAKTMTVEYMNLATGARTNGGTVAGGATRTLNPGFSGAAVVYLSPATSGVSLVQCSPSSIAGGSSSNCTVTLAQAAPAGGATVALSDNNSALTVPASVAVPAGSPSATFSASAGSVTTNQSVTITASWNGTSASGTLTITAPAPLAVSGLQCSPAMVNSGSTATCTVTLSGAAPSGGAAVALSDNSMVLTTPASVTVPAGAVAANFNVSAGTVTSNRSVTVTASLNGTSAGAALTVTRSALAVSAVQCSSSTVASGSSTTCTVTLSSGAPAGGTVVTVSDSSTSLTTPMSVSVSGGAASATFTASAGFVMGNRSVTVTASLNGTSASITVTVTPAGLLGVSGLQCSPSSVVSGSAASCTVTLSGAAPSGGASVTISDSSTVLTTPASVTVASGAASAAFSASAGSVTASQPVTVTASLNGTSATATVTVTPPVTTGSGPVAAYGMNQGTGSTVADSSGNGITGTISGASWSTTSKYGKALSFNGAANYVDLGNPSALNSTGSMTWSAWVYATANPVDDGQIVARSTDTAGWQFKTSPDTGRRTFAIAVRGSGAAGHTQRYSNTVLSLGTWYHVAGVYNASARTLDLYVNGVLDNGVLSGTVPTSQVLPATSTTIGRRVSGFNFAGVIDELRIYTRALSQAEIQSDMNTPIVP